MKRRWWLLACFFCAGCEGRAGSEGAESRVEANAAVSTAKVEKGKVDKTVVAYGTVEFAADRQRTLSFVKPGQVVSVVVVAGQTIKKGDTLLLVGGVPRGSLQVQQASIDVEFAQRELVRVQRLVEQKLATNQELEGAEKRLAAAKAALGGLGGGGAGSSRMQSSTDGVVAQVLVQRGDQVQAGQAAVVVAERDAMTARAGFEVEDLSLLGQGLTARLSPVYGEFEDRQAEATLSTLHRVVDPKTQLVEGLIHVKEPPPWMAAGLAVKVNVVVETRNNVLLLPRDALVRRGTQQGVYVVDKGHAHFHVLELGIEGTDQVEVKKGLSVGASVVTTGRSSLVDGMAVRVSGTGSS